MKNMNYRPLVCMITLSVLFVFTASAILFAQQLKVDKGKWPKKP